MELTIEQMKRAVIDMEEIAHNYLSHKDRNVRDMALYTLAHIKLIRATWSN